MLKIIFFEVSTIVLIYMKFQHFDIRGFVLETEHTSDLVLMSWTQNWAQITILTNEWKIDILNSFAPRIEFWI